MGRYQLLKTTLRSIVGKGARGRQACPGEERCPKYNTAVNPDTVCDKCPSNFFKQRIKDIPGSMEVIPWINHLIWLDGLKHVGCNFLLNDLTYEEWEGLLLLQTVRNEIEVEMMEKDKRKQQLQAATTETIKRR